LSKPFSMASQGERVKTLVSDVGESDLRGWRTQECEDLEGAEGERWALLSVTISEDGLRIAFCGKGDGGARLEVK
jgi:hypothetical protein